MSINKKELTKLSPEERIKKLKQMEEGRKKEVNEIGKLITESMQELKTVKLIKEIAPEQRIVDISRLFEAVGEQALERTARKERQTALMKGARYQTVVQTYQDYSKLKKFYSAVSMGGSLTEEERRIVGEIGERINRAERYIPTGEKTANILDASRTVLYKLKKETGLG